MACQSEAGIGNPGAGFFLTNLTCYPITPCHACAPTHTHGSHSDWSRPAYSASSSTRRLPPTTRTRQPKPRLAKLTTGSQPPPLPQAPGTAHPAPRRPDLPICPPAGQRRRTYAMMPRRRPPPRRLIPPRHSPTMRRRVIATLQARQPKPRWMSRLRIRPSPQIHPFTRFSWQRMYGCPPPWCR